MGSVSKSLSYVIGGSSGSWPETIRLAWHETTRRRRKSWHRASAPWPGQIPRSPGFTSRGLADAILGNPLACQVTRHPIGDSMTFGQPSNHEGIRQGARTASPLSTCCNAYCKRPFSTTQGPALGLPEDLRKLDPHTMPIHDPYRVLFAGGNIGQGPNLALRKRDRRKELEPIFPDSLRCDWFLKKMSTQLDSCDVSQSCSDRNVVRAGLPTATTTARYSRPITLLVYMALKLHPMNWLAVITETLLSSHGSETKATVLRLSGCE
ncbi:hypothetical protein F4780DRAFT_270420 [Xylariomycetidae sp. FL0641]|nr:hypothetical protein F4780DRAFT_270420 [Xylariomycetidae sp. FL0641]